MLTLYCIRRLDMELDIERLIADFGGPGALTEGLNRLFPDEPVTRAAIYKWRERGSIPTAQFARLDRLAASQGRSFNIHHYFTGATIAPVLREPAMSERLYIFDTTLRDGEQSPGASMTREEKIRIARQLEKLGVDIIEAGFAAASPGDAEAIRAIAETIKESTICSLARATERDIRIAGEAIAPAARKRIHTFIATSPIHMEKKLRMTPDEVVDAAVKAVRLAANIPTMSNSRPKTLCAPIRISWSACLAKSSRPAPKPSMCPTPWVTPCRLRLKPSSATSSPARQAAIL